MKKHTSKDTLDGIKYNLGFITAIYVQATKGDKWDDTDDVSISLSKLHDLIETLKEAEYTIEELETYLNSAFGR